MPCQSCIFAGVQGILPERSATINYPGSYGQQCAHVSGCHPPLMGGITAISSPSASLLAVPASTYSWLRARTQADLISCSFGHLSRRAGQMLSLVAPAAEVPCCRWSRQVAAAQHRATQLLTFGKLKCVC